MRLPVVWENFLEQYIDAYKFYKKLDIFLGKNKQIIPEPSIIFNIFSKIPPENVRCVLYGEDPYPRITSANGIAFWDNEIKNWDDKTHGNSLKNILKALLVFNKNARYETSIENCRIIANKIQFKSPPQLFESWLKQGVFLVNVALTYSTLSEKKSHFEFWKPFHSAFIHALNVRDKSPHYILWGKKAQQWEKVILKTIDQPSKIIKQGHPTFIHQFLNPKKPDFSPFTELQKKTGIQWF